MTLSLKTLSTAHVDQADEPQGSRSMWNPTIRLGKDLYPPTSSTPAVASSKQDLPDFAAVLLQCHWLIVFA